MTSLLKDAFLGISMTWTCIRCRKDFPGGPHDLAPYAIETKREGDRTVIVGDICEDCYRKGETKK
jgi:hypothetical protein